MRKSIWVAVGVVCFCSAVIVWNVSAQAKENPAKSSDTAHEDGPQEYLRITAAELEKSPKSFRNQYVELPDVFNKRAKPSKKLRRHGIYSKTHIGFLTHPAFGSNSYCVIARDNKEAIKALDTLVEESPIYIQGRVGVQITLEGGGRTLFIIDQIVRGHRPPPAPKVEKQQKPVTMIIEVPILDKSGRPVTGPDNRIRRRIVGRYTIRKPNTRYVIPDPYDNTRVIYVTLKH